jgi:hypothetical protein
MAEEYDRGFAAGFEFARMCVLSCYVAGDESARSLKDHIDHHLQTAITEAETDPAALRRRLMDQWNNQPKPTAEIINLADARAMLQGAA